MSVMNLISSIYKVNIVNFLMFVYLNASVNFYSAQVLRKTRIYQITSNKIFFKPSCTDFRTDATDFRR